MRTHIRSEDKTPRSSLRLSLALVAVSVLALFVVAPAVAQPVNDDFDNATVVGTLPFSDSISAADATAAPDDPGCIGSDDHTAWYSFTPTSDVRISADTTGSDYSPTLSVYTGSRGALTQIACNFGDTGVAFEAAAGTTYYFMVGSCCGSAGGNLVFNLSEAPTVTSLTVDHVNPVTKPGIVTISGTVACSTPTVLYAFEVDLEQVFAGRLVASGFGRANSVDCSPTASRWQFSFDSQTSVRFGPGKATAQAFAYLYINGVFFTTSTTSTVTLHRA